MATFVKAGGSEVGIEKGLQNGSQTGRKLPLDLPQVLLGLCFYVDRIIEMIVFK
jgi:hypothetical protein